MSNEITGNKNCLGCGVGYESKTFLILGVRINFDHGYCSACRQKKLDEMLAQEEACRLAEIAQKRRHWRNNCGIPAKFINKEFGTFEVNKQPLACKKCFDYAEKFPLGSAVGYPSLILLGIWGSGKTHLVCSIAHHILNRWNGEEISCPILFTTEPDLFRRIQTTYNIPQEEKALRENENDIYNHLIRVPLLILDDIGKEERADMRFVQRVLFAIIDGRYRVQLPMVLTTNLSPENLNTYLGGERGSEAIYDRLVEMSDGKFLQLKGESYRRRGKEMIEGERK